MAQRIRRNLSDPAIKRIVKKQLSAQGDSDAGRGRREIRPGLSAGHRIFWIMVLLVAGGLLYLNWDQVGPVVNKYLRPSPVEAASPAGDIPHDQAIAESAAVVAEPEVTEAAPVANQIEKRIQVEILNGCGANGIAEKMQKYLREKNIDVVGTGNYKNFKVKKSRIIARNDLLSNSLSVAEVIGYPAKSVESVLDNNLQLDATIILGADYPDLEPYK